MTTETCRPIDQYTSGGLGHQCLPHTGINLTLWLCLAALILLGGLVASWWGRRGRVPR